MGYRSQVAIGLTDSAATLLKTIMKHDPKVRDLINTADTNANISWLKIDPSRDNGGNLYWDYIKWNSEWDDVAAVQVFLAALPDEDYRFLRVGENYEDVEEAGSFYESDIFLQRAISW